ncbi:MAG: amidohydrolase family protein [Hydrogenophilaceae bacterium]|nr:amidohydrolase family protein [Hydrogenophilaceae bacterium]
MRQVFFFLLPLLPAVACADGVYIDTHAHLVAGGPGSVRADYHKDFVSSASKALQVMDSAGIRMTLIMPTPQRHDNWNRYDYQEFLPAIRAYPHRFAFLGGGAILNSLILKAAETGTVSEEDRKLFIDNAKMILRDGAAGFGELAAEHFGLGKFGAFHSYQSAPPDHELFLLLADIAAQHDVPIDLHMELVPEDMPLPERPGLKKPPNPDTLKSNLAAFERLLAHNRAARIVWVHAGWDVTGTRDIPAMRRLLARHPNLYMSIKLAAKVGLPRSKPLDENGQIKQSWIGLFRDFPDRFLIGTDTFYDGGNDWGIALTPAAGLVDLPLQLMRQLPEYLARKIGYENARRIYKLGQGG